MRSWRLGAALALIASLGACDEDTATAGDTTDVAGDASGDEDTTPAAFAEGQSAWRLAVTTEIGQQYTIARDITGDTTVFAFGSTHIGPAVSLAMTQSLTDPATIVFGLNFGIVVGSEAHPVQTTGPGSYSFGVAAPGVEIFVNPAQYRSRVEGSEGTLVITRWGTEPGDVVAGHFSGRVLHDTDKPDKKWADVEGAFQLILPERQSGQ